MRCQHTGSCKFRATGIKRHAWGTLQEENLRAALLLEQAALCLLRVQPPAVRKFAFHLVLAGLRYNACDQKGLGTRAYRRAPGGFFPC
jgi:hypothetical protein